MKDISIGFLSIDFNKVERVEIEKRAGEYRVYFWQPTGDGGREIAASFTLGEKLEIQTPEADSAKTVQFSAKTLAAAERRLRKGWCFNYGLRRVTGLSHSSIPAVLTDLRRLGHKIERRKIKSLGASQWRIAAND